MALTLNLYVINKRTNSTATPSGSGTVYTGEFIDDTDILNPSVRLITTNAAMDPTGYNYAKLKSRYYWINTWTYTVNGWIADMHVDVLGTYRDQIGNTSFYLLRSSYAHDGNIIDNLYQTKTDITYSKQTITAPWLQAIDAGCYIVGVVSPDPQFGSISYYVLPASSLAALGAYLMNTAISTGNGFNTADASMALQKSLIDPFQYIKSCTYIPIAYNSVPSESSFTTFKIWDWSIPNCPGKVLAKANPQYTQTRNFTLSKHPQTSARGNWVNTSPYTRVELQFPPFGVVNLDTSITAANPYISIDYRIDLVSGLAAAWLYAAPDANTTPRVLIGNMESMCGIPIQLSQVVRDYYGAATGILGAIGNFATGNIIGGIAGAVGSAVQAQYPHVSTQGSNGAFYQLITEAACYETFYPLIEEDNAHFGRPLCGKGIPADYPGYLLIDHGDIQISGAYSTELDEIKSYLEGGFYFV